MCPQTIQWRQHCSLVWLQSSQGREKSQKWILCSERHSISLILQKAGIQQNFHPNQIWKEGSFWADMYFMCSSCDCRLVVQNGWRWEPPEDDNSGSLVMFNNRALLLIAEAQRCINFKNVAKLIKVWTSHEWTWNCKTELLPWPKNETNVRTWRMICRACTQICLACVPVSIFLARVVVDYFGVRFCPPPLNSLRNS